MGYGSFFEGLSQGYGQRFQRDQANLQNKRQQEQVDINERRVRNTELDSVQREARRVAEQDRADEQQTMQMLMQPGLTEESRKAIRDARVARRNDNTAYIRSLSADPTNAADISKRFGDITKLITPSTIEAGVMPSPTVDMLKATDYADKYRKEIGLLPEAKRGAEVTYRQGLLGQLGLNPSQIQTLMPDFGKVMSTTPGKASEFMPVETPFNLPENLMFGGKQFDEKLGKTIETQLQPDGKTLKKRYVEPDVEQTMTYDADIISSGKAKKYEYEAPRIKAQIAKLEAETKAIPQKVQLGVNRFLADVKDKNRKNDIAKMLVGVRQTGNSIKMWGLQRADARGRAMLGLRSRGLDIAEGKVGAATKAKLQAGVDDLKKQLFTYQKDRGTTADEQRTAEGRALDEIIGVIQEQIAASEAALAGYDSDEGLEMLLGNEGIQYNPPPAYSGLGGFGGYPGGGYGGGGTAPTGGGSTFNIGGQQVTAEQLAAIMQGGGYNAGTVGVGGTQKKTGYVDAKGNPIDPKKLGGTAGKKATHINIGGNLVPLTGPGAPKDANDAVTRYLGG